MMRGSLVSRCTFRMMQLDRLPDHRVPVCLRVCMRHAKACQNLSWQYALNLHRKSDLEGLMFWLSTRDCIYLDTGVCVKKRSGDVEAFHELQKIAPLKT